MRKILRIFGFTVVALVVLLMVLPFAFRGKIESVVKSEGNKMLNAQFDFESLDISLLRRFPLASVSLNDFWLKGVGVFENDTLVRAGELTAAVNLMSLVSGDYEITKIIVDDTDIKAIVLEDGRANWDVMKSSGETEQAEQAEQSGDVSFNVALKKLSVSDFNLVYDDRQGGMYAAIEDFDATCSGDFGSEDTTVKLAAHSPSLSFRMGGVPFLSRASVKADMDVAADFVNQKFTLNDNELQLNAI
ncbi:MAG: AsmA family protein, partial [Alistipes sp.]|nr:AsmA family protein [Alistipes sp.]